MTDTLLAVVLAQQTMEIYGELLTFLLRLTYWALIIGGPLMVWQSTKVEEGGAKDIQKILGMMAVVVGVGFLWSDVWGDFL